ncbi:hypothetical protein DM02DRAFT_729266 [Periconia macrospinosa]|uniref:Uncharacterized protein n=1 Tax=Periconia macrospinosa TaxID=97972 RepID=A0A2V1DMB4_9PLEO|nr:hypothetical protein DM02DRAFT_729266 [Periconia macrospinosa]
MEVEKYKDLITTSPLLLLYLPVDQHITHPNTHLNYIITNMQPITYLAAILGLATATIASPVEGSSAIQARTLVDATLTCGTGITTPNNGAKLYTLLCIQSFGCQHSIAPQQVDNEYVGSCLNCPKGNSESKIGDCVYIEN